MKFPFYRTTSLLLIFALIFIYAFPQRALAATTSQTYVTAGNTWIAPPGVTSIQVEAWGGGGAGSQRTSNGGGGGGAGGEYAKETSVTVTPGRSYTITVGAAGTTATPTNGGNSQFIGDNVTVLAHGGASVANNTTAGAATTTGSTNSAHFDGGKGADAPAGTSGGGGGSSAGTATFGVQGISNTGGVAPAGGGVGGNGASAGNNNGSAPASGNGGGGGGADRSSSGTRTGGAGAIGEVILTYTTPLISNLTDQLNTNTYNTAVWAKAGTPANVSLVNNDLEITVPLSTTQYNSYDSIEQYDWAGGYAYVHVFPPTTTNVVSQEAGLVFKIDASNDLWLFVGDSLVKAFKLVGGVQTQVGSNIAYDSTQDAYLRIRESGGTFYYEVSPDAVTWTNPSGWSVANPFSGNTVGYARIYSQHWQSETVSTTDKFDSFNVVATPATPSSAIYDDGAWLGEIFQ